MLCRSLTVSAPDNVEVTLFVADLSMDEAILATDLSSELKANISWSCWHASKYFDLNDTSLCFTFNLLAIKVSS